MSEETGVPAGPEPVTYATADDSPMTVEEAARSLHDARNKAIAQANKPPAESAEAATAATELSDEDSAESQETETTGEDQADEPETPAIDPPKSWTKDLHERWKSLDPETQKTIVERDRQDQAAIKRAFNEAADDRKAAKAERDAAEQVRKQYEAKLPALEKKLQTVGPFADIQSMEDVKKMKEGDPFRFLDYQVYIWEQQAEQSELREAESRKAQEHQSSWAQHVQKENELAAEYIPELADKDKAEKLVSRVAKELLPELGFKQSELDALASGKDKLSIYDHRVQRLLADALKLRDIKSAPKAVATKPLPPVQRPGASKPASSGAATQIQALEKQLSSASGDKAARISAEIWRLERKTRSA